MLFLILISLLISDTKDNTYSSVVDYSKVVEVNGRKIKTTTSYTIRVSEKDDNWLGDIVIPYHSGSAYKFHEAVLLDRHLNPVRKIKKRDIQTSSAPSDVAFFDDRLMDRFTLKHNEFPYFIKYSYEVTVDDYQYLAHWYPSRYNSISTQKASLTVIRPADMDIKIDSTGKYAYEKVVSDDRISETWSIRYPDTYSKEAYSVPEEESLEHLFVIPKEFNYGVKGEHSSWVSYGNWMLELNKDLDQLTSLDSIRIRNRFQLQGDTVALIRDLYHFLQDQTRYINVSLDMGGFKSYSASYVHDNKYGDCKALTTYMKALLNCFGIDSNYFLIYAGNNPKRVNVDYPSSQFNHVILSVPLSSDTLWLENTSTYTPFNYLGSFTQGRKGLFVSPDRSKIISTPNWDVSSNEIRNTFRMELTSENISSELTSTFIGTFYERWAGMNKYYSVSEKKESVENYLTQYSGEHENTTVIIPERDQPKAVIKATINLDHSLRKIGNMYVFQLPKLPNLPDENDFRNRQTPIRIQSPMVFSDSISISLSEDLQSLEVGFPENIALENTYGSLNITYRQKNKNIMVISRKFVIHQGDYEVTESERINAFLTAASNELNQSILLTSD